MDNIRTLILGHFQGLTERHLFVAPRIVVLQPGDEIIAETIRGEYPAIVERAAVIHKDSDEYKLLVEAMDGIEPHRVMKIVYKDIRDISADWGLDYEGENVEWN